jgi:hypothetical protein
MPNVLIFDDGSAAVASDGECEDCTAWQLRFEVAVRASYYLTIHVAELELRTAIIDDLAANWAVSVRDRSTDGGFRRFFADYCRDVEREIDASTKNTSDHRFEYRRVWVNHARCLRGEFDLVTSRWLARFL